MKDLFTAEPVIKEYKIDTIQYKTNIQKLINQFKQGLISKEKLLKQVNEKDGLYYYKDVAVFCNCLFSQPCLVCFPPDDAKEDK